MDAVPSLVLPLTGTELSQGQKLVTFFISNFPSKLSLPSIYLVPFNQLREKRNELPEAARNVCGPWRRAVLRQGAQTLGGVLDTFQLLRFWTDFLFLMFVSFISPQGFDLGRNHMGWGTALEGGRRVHSAVRLQVAACVAQTAVWPTCRVGS